MSTSMPDANANDGIDPRPWFDRSDPDAGWGNAIRRAEGELLDRWRRAMAEHDEAEVDRLVRASRSARFRASAVGDGEAMVGERQPQDPWNPWSQRDQRDERSPGDEVQRNPIG